MSNRRALKLGPSLPSIAPRCNENSYEELCKVRRNEGETLVLSLLSFEGRTLKGVFESVIHGGANQLAVAVVFSGSVLCGLTLAASWSRPIERFFHRRAHRKLYIADPHVRRRENSHRVRVVRPNGPV
jgi:hypothetical protein